MADGPANPLSGPSLAEASRAAGAYTDLQALGRLRAAAGQQSPEALAAVAQQFEALFLGMMLDSMREASSGEGLFDNNETQLYQQLLDRQFALEASRGQGLGIARSIIEQLGSRLPPAAEGAAPRRSAEQGAPAAPAPVLRPANAMGPWPEEAHRPRFAPPPAASAGAAAAASEPAAREFRPASPLEFLREVLPHATRAAQQLGVHPLALVAQAALETGWGSKLPRAADGSSSFNLFGVKAGARWAGGRAAAATLEFEGGVAVRRTESFRAYGGLAEAFDDYVHYIKSSPRYADALAAGADPRKYAAELQAAGYATDPRYAQKIAAILDGDLFAAPSRS